MRGWVTGVILGITCAASLAASGEISILCTTTIVGDVVAYVAGDRLDVDVLLPVNADPHSFEATPSDLVRIARATVIFESGAGLEEFLVPLLEATTARVVDLSAGLLLRGLSSENELGDAGTDPHVWLDPTNVIHWLDGITAVLENLDPDGAAEYRERSFSYARALRDLDAWIAEQTSRIPPERRRLVTDHDSFGYFARRYGFHLIGTVLPGLSAVAEPSARDLAALEDAVRKLGVPAIFVGTTTNPALATQVAADTGTRLVVLYTGSLSAANGPAPTYVDLLRYNVTQIVAALTES